jgi:hypothetical protein
MKTFTTSYVSLLDNVIVMGIISAEDNLKALQKLFQEKVRPLEDDELLLNEDYLKDQAFNCEALIEVMLID